MKPRSVNENILPTPNNRTIRLVRAYVELFLSNSKNRQEEEGRIYWPGLETKDINCIDLLRWAKWRIIDKPCAGKRKNHGITNVEDLFRLA